MNIEPEELNKRVAKVVENCNDFCEETGQDWKTFVFYAIAALEIKTERLEKEVENQKKNYNNPLSRQVP